MAEQKNTRTKRIIIVVVVLAAVLAGVSIWYANDYYRADAVALAVVADKDGNADGVTVSKLPDGSLVFKPDNPRAGLVFYPGGKVQPEAYAPLLQRCAQQGILCVLEKPLFNLAILDKDMADGVQTQFPEIKTWIIAGHSLGGVVAADYLSNHKNDYAGIALLAAYPSSDLSGYNGSEVSVVGSNDGVMNRQAYENAREKLPSASPSAPMT